VPWTRIVPLLPLFWARVSARVERRHRAGRLKQWLNYLRHRHPEAQQAFDELRLQHEPPAIEAWLQQAQTRWGCTDEASAETAQAC
jgi:tRNA-dihydrouridine synthase C